MTITRRSEPVGAGTDLPPTVPIELERESGVPLAVQLADTLRAAAAAGQLRGGDRLPSTRALAGRLGVSRTVTAAAPSGPPSSSSPTASSRARRASRRASSVLPAQVRPALGTALDAVLDATGDLDRSN